MTAIITRATVVGGHDGRAEIEVELTYDNGGTSTISLDEEACIASLDERRRQLARRAGGTAVEHRAPGTRTTIVPTEKTHARSRHP